MIVPGADHDYDVSLAGELLIGEAVESMSMGETFDEVSVRATIDMVVPDPDAGVVSLPIKGGQDIQILGYPFDSRSSRIPIFEVGVVWETSSIRVGTKTVRATCYDKTIYLAKSNDEILFPAGETAYQRLARIANLWGIPMAPGVPDTGIQLAKAIRRGVSLYGMIQADLIETATKGGKLYRPRMTIAGLTLFEVGSNADVWMLEVSHGISSVTQVQSLEGAVTRVKVLGKEEDDEMSPILAIEEKDSDKYGLLQRIIRDEKATNSKEASTIAKAHLMGMTETVTVESVDINTIRVADKVNLDGWELIVTGVSRSLGNPGAMTLDLADIDLVRRRYFTDET